MKQKILTGALTLAALLTMPLALHAEGEDMIAQCTADAKEAEVDKELMDDFMKECLEKLGYTGEIPVSKPSSGGGGE